MLPPEARLPEARGLIERGEFFVVHAPQPTGKTTTLWALARALTAEGRFAALHFSCEAAEPVGDDFQTAQLAVLDSIRFRAAIDLPPDCRPPHPWPGSSDAQLVSAGLAAWSARCPRPVVLFFDEIDALRGESLRSVLRQLRAGYPNRPASFPAAVVLCGLRDVRDYKVASGGDPSRLGTSSPFNVKVDSLRMGDFTESEVRALFAQHTAETGQRFDDEALRRAWELTQGQPWLVNALAREIVEKMGVSSAAPITVEHIDEAKERLILARATHLDSLVARLLEPRVRRVMEPILAGTLEGDETYQDDLLYVRDLGLIAAKAPVRVANPIYREVVVRVLAYGVQERLPVEPRSFIQPDGRLAFRRLLEEFAAFWREHGEVLHTGMGYHEVAPQLVLMAYLQRIVNGGGYVDREYGVGRGRIDLCVRWPYATAGAGARQWQREALELKVWAPGKPDPLSRGLEQLDGYLEGLGLDRGVLVIFDRRPDAAPIADRTRFEEAVSAKGRAITVLRA
ncbi:MAG: ATP-binding protein [Deltaproteobacteria bacterium]|nr:ATP-binding protein [Deltaproteobacteria bacterium]